MFQSKLKQLPILIFILGIVLFDAFQQKYYLDTFDLYPEGIPVSFLALLKGHLIRWAIYLIIHVPVFLLVFKWVRNEAGFDSAFILKTAGVLLASLLVTLIGISVLSLLSFDLPLSLSGLLENFLFFFYQKGLTFLIVSAGLVLFTISIWQRQEIDKKTIEILDLRIEKSQLASRLQNEKEAEITMKLKVGKKLHVISSSEIIWVQSDDYCVKVHTQTKSYSLRKSMKELTEQLSPYGFVRVHRSAIFNTYYLDQIDYQNSIIRLKDHSDVPFSQSGIRALKKVMNEQSLA